MNLKLNSENITAIVLILVGLIYIFLKNSNKNLKIKSHRNTTLCKIVEYDNIGKTGSFFEYEYYINNEKHSARIQSGNKGIKYEKRYFLIEYSEQQPELSNILFDNEITDTITIKSYGFELNPPKHKSPINW